MSSTATTPTLPDRSSSTGSDSCLRPLTPYPSGDRLLTYLQPTPATGDLARRDAGPWRGGDVRGRPFFILVGLPRMRRSSASLRKRNSDTSQTRRTSDALRHTTPSVPWTVPADLPLLDFFFDCTSHVVCTFLCGPLSHVWHSFS